MALRFATNVIATWFGAPRWELEVDDARIQIHDDKGTRSHAWGVIVDVASTHRVLWTHVDIALKSGERLTLRGVGWWTYGGLLVAFWERAIASCLREAVAWLELPCGRDQFMTRWMLDDWFSRYRFLAKHTRWSFIWARSSSALKQAVVTYDDWNRKGHAARRARNEQWTKAQKAKHSMLFSSQLGYPLNAEQIDAIVNDDHRVMVVAGAGTGKTSTIVGKVAWLINQGLAEPHEIGVVAFNKSAANELRDRIQEKTQSEPQVHTFHALGYKILGASHGVRPSLSRLTDDSALEEFLKTQITAGLRDPAISERILDFIAYFRFPSPKPIPFEGSHEAFRYAESVNLRSLPKPKSLTNVTMESRGEVAIANWLTLNGIEWEYERKYEKPTASPQHSQYKPDFYLPEYKLYVELWACERSKGGEEGKLPEEWRADEQKRYRESMQWKRALHARHGTTLVEVFQSQRGIFDMLRELELALVSKHKVCVRPLSAGERAKLIDQLDEEVSDTTKLVKSFLALYREGNQQAANLRKQASKLRDERALRFFDMFEWILGRYEEELRLTDEIDFSDMINQATAAVRDATAQVPLRYLMVDEFQDTSVGKAEFIKALLQANPECRLFVVGDDWQSIYRFAGSDIGVMVRFREFFGEEYEVKLQQTHRFGSRLLEASSRFVQANPSQIAKQLRSGREDDLPRIVILASRNRFSIDGEASDADTNGMPGREDAASPADAGNAVRRAVGTGKRTAVAATSDAARKELSFVAEGPAPEYAVGLPSIYQMIADERPGPVEVLVLGRYRHLEAAVRDAKEHQPKEMKVRFSTVHRAKGDEADYVIVLAVTSGRLGFPTEVADDPLLSFVLAMEEGHPNAEERRLFYVALTRARYKAYLLTEATRMSAFVDELQKSEYRGLVLPCRIAETVPECRTCRGGRMELRTGQYGPFIRCSHYPRCSGRLQECPNCSRIRLQRDDKVFECWECKARLPICPGCGEGYLKLKPAGISSSGRPYSQFWGCSSYHPAKPDGCKYTQHKAPGVAI